MFSNFEKVIDFHKKFELPVGTYPAASYRGMYHEDESNAILLLRQAENYIRRTRFESDVAWGRIQMMLEELREYAEAVHADDIAGQADSLVDLEYFVLGTSVTCGFPHDACFDEVHRANMEKVRVQSAEESRRLNKLDVKKPEGWTPPDIHGIIAKARMFARAIATR